jgi:hypothetical protein
MQSQRANLVSNKWNLSNVHTVFMNLLHVCLKMY